MELYNPQLAAFIIATLILTITPGVDTIIVMRNVLRGGKLDGIFTSFGICTGLFVHATISACGISILLVNSTYLFFIVKTIGALYLIWLGINTIHNSITDKKSTNYEENNIAIESIKYNKSFTEGLLSNILNPKPAIFYMAFLPQFIVPSDSVFFKSMYLASIQFSIGIIWLITLSFLFFRIKNYLTEGKTKKILDRLSGTVLIGLGIKLGAQAD